MSGSLQMQVCEAARAAIAAAVAVDGGVHRGRRGRAMPEQFQRQVNVYLDFAKVERGQLAGSPDDWFTRLRIECAAREGAGTTGEDESDALAAACYAAIAGEPSLGGLCSDMVPIGMAWDTEEGDVSIGVCQLIFDARHRTQSTSITAP